MRISVIGCGFLGAVHASAMTELGHEVVGIHVDERRTAQLAAGRPSYFDELEVGEALDRSGRGRG